MEEKFTSYINSDNFDKLKSNPYFLSFLNSILTILLLIIIFPELNSQLGLPDLPNYAVLIRYGPSSYYDYLYSVIMHSTWNILKFSSSNQMLMFIMAQRLIFAFIIIFFLSIFLIFSLDEKIDFKLLIAWLILFISFNLLFIESFIFVRLRLSLALSLFLTGLFIFKKSRFLIVKVLALGLIFFSMFVHELVFIISFSLLFGYFLSEILTKEDDLLKIKNARNLLFTLILVIESLLIIVINNLTSVIKILPSTFGYLINVNTNGNYFLLLSTIFNLTYIFMIGIQIILFFKGEKISKIILVYFIIIGLFLSGTFIVTSPIYYLFFLLNLFFWIIIFLYKSDLYLSKIEWTLIGCYLICSTFNRFQQDFYLTVNKTSLSLHLYITEFILLGFLSLRLFTTMEPTFNEFLSLLITKLEVLNVKQFKHKQLNYLKIIAITLIVIIGLSNFSILIFHSYYPDGWYQDIYKNEKGFNELTLKMASDIKIIEKEYNRSMRIIDNDLRISLRLTILLGLNRSFEPIEFQPTFWNFSQSVITNYLQDLTYHFVAVTNSSLSGFNPPDFTINSHYVLINSYSIGKLYLILP